MFAVIGAMFGFGLGFLIGTVAQANYSKKKLKVGLAALAKAGVTDDQFYAGVDAMEAMRKKSLLWESQK